MRLLSFKLLRIQRNRDYEFGFYVFIVDSEHKTWQNLPLKLKDMVQKDYTAGQNRILR